MKYKDGLDVRIGDVVSVPISSGSAMGRVVMLGDTYEHLGIDAIFSAGCKRTRFSALIPLSLNGSATTHLLTTILPLHPWETRCSRQ